MRSFVDEDIDAVGSVDVAMAVQVLEQRAAVVVELEVERDRELRAVGDIGDQRVVAGLVERQAIADCAGDRRRTVQRTIHRTDAVADVTVQAPGIR